MNARIAVLVASLFASTGCATLMAPKHASLEVNSNIPGAEIKVNGQVQGNTPGQVTFPRGETPKIEVSYPGFRSQSCNVHMQAKTTYIAADVALCVVLFPFGCVSFIDAGGAWDEPSSNSCSVNLQPDYTSPYAAHPVAQTQPGAWQGHPVQQPPVQQQPVQPAAHTVHPAPPPGYQLVPVNHPPQPAPAYQRPPGYQLVPIR